MQSRKQDEREHQAANQALQPRSGDIEIPASEWTSFLDSFSLQHEGWLATISATSGPERSVKVREARLKCITATELDERRHIRIVALGDDKDHLIHQVSNPVSLTFRRDLSGAHQGLDIPSADGSITSLRFRVAAIPETLDDVLPDMHRTETKHSYKTLPDCGTNRYEER
jgi:hypothetical protein